MQLEEIEQLHDEHIESINAQERGKKIGKVLVIAKPILKILSNSFFIPQKWRNILSILVEEIDLITK